MHVRVKKRSTDSRARMSVECANSPLDERRLVDARRALVEELSLPARLLVEPVHPLIAYAILFGETPNSGIQRRVRGAYTYVSRSIRRRSEWGYIYVFRDTRDGDSAIVKIGSSVNVRRRITEWRASLNAREDELALLFSAKSGDIRLAEQIMHTLLFCQWLPKRVNTETGRLLLEYFLVPNLDALRLLLQAVARHASWFTDTRQVRRASMFV